VVPLLTFFVYGGSCTYALIENMTKQENVSIVNTE
jgi:hypothetical protein